MEASVKIYAGAATDVAALRALSNSTNDVDGLDRALIVSHVELVSSPEEVKSCAHVSREEGEDMPRFLVGMDKSAAPKCERCWHYDDTIGSNHVHPEICSRCGDAVSGMEIVVGALEGAATGS